MSWIAISELNGLRIPYKSDAYNYRVIVDNAQTFDYFQVMAPNFTKDIHIGLARIEGFQNSTTDFTTLIFESLKSTEKFIQWPQW